MCRQTPMDCHNHSNLSPDAEHSPELMVKKAIELGIMYYALTDHCEINQFYDEEYLYEEPVRKASEIIPLLKDKYSDKINIAYGVELGQPLHDKPLTDRILSTYNYDFIIGSVHMCRGFDDFYFIDFSTYKELDSLLDLYFDELYEMAEWGGFDVMGHITYPFRYIVGDYKIPIDMNKYMPKIKDILKKLIKNDCGIEINSSGLRQKIGEPLPNEQIVSLYMELGGRILTVGSDAHCTEDLGKGIYECIEIAKKIGFKELAFFNQRKPQFITI